MYSWDYGIETKDLIGEKSTYVIPELERVIKEALLQDDRIEDVEDFIFKQTSKNTITATFRIVTILGDVVIEKEVSV